MDAATICPGYALTGMPVGYTAPDRDEPLARAKGCSAKGSNDSSSDPGLDIWQTEMGDMHGWSFVRKLEIRVVRVGANAG